MLGPQHLDNQEKWKCVPMSARCSKAVGLSPCAMASFTAASPPVPHPITATVAILAVARMHE